MKILFLWSHLSGYFNACLKELDKHNNVELFVVNMTTSSSAPYGNEMFSWIKNRYEYIETIDYELLDFKIKAFNPDVIICANWHNKSYRKILTSYKSSLRIFTSDRPWINSLKQRLGKLTAKFYLNNLSDAFWVAGERQAIFAKKMGYTQRQILYGLYCCDFNSFSSIYNKKYVQFKKIKKFIFVGRLVKEKGMECLISAYKKYREITDDPWDLVIYGSGPFENYFKYEVGVDLKGFCQPEFLPDKFTDAGCLILPSIFEPWGVVVHEAAAAGLPLILSDKVGSSVHLLRDGFNGFLFESSNSYELAKAMQQISNLDSKELELMGHNSFQMSKQYTPTLWSEYLINKIKNLR